MIKDLEVAREATTRAMNVGEELNEIARLIRQRCPEDEAQIYVRGIGHVLAELHDRLLAPVFRTHPELLPESWRSWFK